MKYFDHAASAPLYPEVLELLAKSWAQDFANPSSKHVLGHDLNELIELYRKDFLKKLKAHKSDFFYFTSSATESNNTVVNGLPLKAGDSVLYSPADHPSLSAPIEFLAKKLSLQLQKIPLNSEGLIDQEEFKVLLNENVKFVALTHVNNQSGVIQDITTLSKMIKANSTAHVHVDAVQSFGKIPLELCPSIDSLSVTSHKLGGPKAIAGLFLKNGHKISPLLLGGGQENGFRSGTVAFPLIQAFHKAMEISHQNHLESLKKITSLNEEIRKRLTHIIPTIQFPFLATSPYVLSLVLPNISSDIILRHLEEHEIYLSSTSACSSKIMGHNPALLALGLPEKLHKSFLRISMGPLTSSHEVDALIEEFQRTWENLKHLQGNK